MEHPSYVVVETAANALDKVVLSINENKKRRENNLALAELSTRLYKLGVCRNLFPRYIYSKFYDF